MIKTTHNAGFFSCCSVKLTDIINYFNTNKKIPNNVDSSEQFQWYKINKTGDITFDYFEHYNNNNNNNNINTDTDTDTDTKIIYKNNINFHYNHQFIDYSKLNYNDICPFIKKYFSPSNEINTIIKNMEEKYNITNNSINNICVLFYRGNDKNRETKICNYNEYIDKAEIILKTNPNIIFLIQSDETEFIDTFTKLYPTNSFYFKDEIRHMKKCDDTVDIVMKNQNYLYSKYYLAITIIMSKCNYIICGSGNCSIWIMFYRGNNHNVYQNLNNQWISS